MSVSRRLSGSRWGRAALAAVALLVGGLVPSPLGRHPEFDRVGPDKALHFLGHAGFAVALTDALAGDDVGDWPAACLAVAGSTALGALVGVLQRPVPGREPERADLVAGVLGSLAAALVWLGRRR